MPSFQSQNIHPENPQRQAGFLTPTTRRYLLGEWDPPSEAQVRSKRSEIKARTRHALADLALLQKHADEELKQSIVHMNEDERLFEEEQMKHLSEGVLWLSLEATFGEDFADGIEDAMYPLRPDMDLSAASEHVIDEAANDNWEPYLRDHFSKLSDNINETGNVSPREASTIIRKSWSK